MKRSPSFNNKPTLYLVATPIGNIEEISSRALKILEETDYIAAEDTRVSGKLLYLIGIKNKKFISCQKYNENSKTNEIIDLIKKGFKVAYLSDAGMPCISDPGSILVKECIKNDINVSPISGPSACLDALIMSGLDTTHFYFHGFLKVKETEKENELISLKNKVETLIFYEAPHRIDKTLNSLYKILGNRNACIIRELTKVHEEAIRGTLEEFISLDKNTLIGEMVIVVEGNKLEDKKEFSDKEIIDEINNQIKTGLTKKEAIIKVSKLLNLSKNSVYSIYHQNNK